MTIVLDNPKLEQDIPLEILHADPVQPRVHPDADLAESIKTQGILQAITVEPITVDNAPDTICEDCGRAFLELAAESGHLLIKDGERRYRGTIAAGRKTILGKVVPPSTEGKRLLQQLTLNTGKPLSPIEEAFAFQRLMEVQGWSQAELARQLGRARSVIGDRIRLVSLDVSWLDLISAGKLQVSHAPGLHLYAAVPAKYQAQAAEALATGWLQGRIEPITIEGLDQALRVVFQKFLTPIGDVSPQYSGPTVEATLDYQGKRKYAADPDLWKPIASAKAKRAKEQAKSASPSRSAPSRNKSVLDQFADLPRRTAGESYNYTPPPGEIRVWAEHQGWDNNFLGLPSVFLATVDRAKLTRIDFRYGGVVLVTTDAVAVKAARDAFSAELKKRIDEHVVELVAQISKSVERFAIAGPGARTLLEGVTRFRSPLPMLALATGVKVEGLPDERTVTKPGSIRISDADANYLATAYVATLAGAVKVTPLGDIQETVRRKYLQAAIKFPAPAKSKKQQKRDARAAGKQVGDPSRAKNVDVGEMRAAVEAGVEEEELAGATA